MAAAPTVWQHLDRSRVYLNAAGRTPLPACVLSAGEVAVRHKATTPWSIGDTEGDKDDVRALFARMLGGGAAARDIAVVPCCSYAMSMAAENLRGHLRARPPGRRRVAVLQDQNPANVMMWQKLCEDEGGELLVIARPANADWAQAVVAALQLGTLAICALPPCHWCDGSIVDLERVAASCRDAGAALVVDATQWIGAAPPLDVVALGICFLACSIHKWLLGPYGACLCYASPSFWHSASPIDHHDRQREGAQHIECLPMDGADGGYPTGFQDGARRLDGGGRPSYIVMPMLLAALRLLNDELGVERVSQALGKMTTEIRKRARALGFMAPRHHAPHILGLRPTAAMPAAKIIVKRLASQPVPVIVGERLGAIRISPHLYNGPADIEALIQGLQDALATPLASRL